MIPKIENLLKKSFFSSVFILVFSNISQAQNYEAALPNVEAKMSKNVSEGKPQFEGISFEYHFTINSENHSVDDEYFLTKISGLIENNFVGSSTTYGQVNNKESTIVISSDSEIAYSELKAFISQTGYEVLKSTSILNLK